MWKQFYYILWTFEAMPDRMQKVHVVSDPAVFIAHKPETQSEPYEVLGLKENLYLTFCVSTLL